MGRRSMWCSTMFVAVLLMAAAAAQAQESTTMEPLLFDNHFNVLYQSEDLIERTYDGRAVSLSMIERSGSGFQSRDPYLFGQLSQKIKLPTGDSAGVVVCFYTHSMTENHDEFDFEFLGNKSGEPIILQTNIYANGKGGREERIELWYDPTEKFHTYTLLWNHNLVAFYVDSVPIRVLKYTPTTKKFYPNEKPMWVFTSIWNGDDWATRGGQDKVNWTYAPFVTHVKDFKLNGCVHDGKGAAPECTSPLYTGTWWSTHDDLNPVEMRKLEWVREKYLTYDYCKDTARYGDTLLEQFPECRDGY
ncbi:unnamed protein product [Calypogeia fissa]